MKLALTTQVTCKDAVTLVGVTSWNGHKTYEERMMQVVRYKFAQVFVVRHTYTLPEKQLREAISGTSE